MIYYVEWNIPKGDLPVGKILPWCCPPPHSLPFLPLSSIVTLISLIYKMKAGPVALPDMKLKLQLTKKRWTHKVWILELVWLCPWTSIKSIFLFNGKQDASHPDLIKLSPVIGRHGNPTEANASDIPGGCSISILCQQWWPKVCGTEWAVTHSSSSRFFNTK